MARYHLKFREFPQPVLAATTALFEEKPWNLTDEEKKVAVQTWLDQMTAHYQMSPMKFVFGDDDGPFEDDPLAWNSLGTVRGDFDEGSEDDDREEFELEKWSLLLLFKEFRRRMTDYGVERPIEMAGRYDDDDEHAWACSLFYTVKPVMFRARVREGRIKRIKPDELLTAETLRRQREGVQQEMTARVRAEMEQETNAEFSDFDAADHEPAQSSATEITIEPEEPVMTEEFRARVERLQAHNLLAGEDVRNLNTRPLRKYVTQIGMDGSWSMSKEDILARLFESDELAQAATSARNAARSEVGTGNVQ